MARTTSTAQINGTKFLFQPKGRGWEVSTWCDCVLGPHWHPYARTNTKAEALRCAGWRTPAERRTLCAHADRNGEGMHWLEPGEHCTQEPRT